MLCVLDSTKQFLEELSEVQINKDSVRKLAETVSEDDLNISEISLAKHSWNKEQLIGLTFVFNTINFCFWAKKDDLKWIIKDDNLDGAIALFRCLENELQRNPDFLNPDELSDLSLGALRDILKGNVTIPLLSERLKQINIFGRVVEKKYDNSILNIFKASNCDAYKLAEILVDDFSCFDDRSNLNGREVGFYKRAQLNSKMIHDVLLFFGEEGLTNLDKLTAFADYKIPQILRKLEILKYSERLTNKIDNFELIDVGSKEENEIRVATIWGVEYLKQELKRKFNFVTSSHVDSMLWNKSQTKSSGDKPYHRTLTTAY